MSTLQVNGQRYRRSTRTEGKRDALVFEAKWKAELLSGRAETRQVAPAVLSPLTLSETVERYWLEELTPRQQITYRQDNALHSAC